MTDEQQAALERLRRVLIDGETLTGVYSGRMREIEWPTDRESICRLVLADYPAGDDCELSRQELIAALKEARETINDMGMRLSWLNRHNPIADSP